MYGTATCGKTGGGWCNYVYETTPYINIGSYKDTSTRALRWGPQAYGYTAAQCVAACPDYRYAALQNGDGTTGWCSCDDDLSNATKYGTSTCGLTGGGWCN